MTTPTCLCRYQDKSGETLAASSPILMFCSQICLIGVSNKLTVMDMIDDLQIISSFNPKKVPFPLYNADQLRDILNYRAERAFNPDVLDEPVIPLSEGLAAQWNDDAGCARLVVICRRYLHKAG